MNVKEEMTVVRIINSYLKHRDSIRPLLEEEQHANDQAVVALLNEEEKKHREDAKHAKEVEETKIKEETKVKEADAFKALDDLGKIQYTLDKQ